MGAVFHIFRGKDGDFQNWVTAHFLTFMTDLETVMATISVFLAYCCFTIR